MEPIGNGSEGDAYRYTKKVLKSLHNANSLCQIYTEVAETRGISSWTRAAYQDLRAHFFRDGQCKIRFAPGAARIAFGELSLGTGDEVPEPMGKLHDIIRIISIAHADEYDRYLGRDSHRPSFKEFDEMYGQRIAKHWTAMKRMLRRRMYGKRRYTIVPLDSFETANKYHEYTKPHGWCHLGSESMYNSYMMAKVGTGRSLPVKLYLALLPGFEDMKETDELYGESMLGIDIGPGGRLVHVNNRWNHAHDNVDERKGDNKYDEVELSDLLGGPFFEICPPYGKDAYREIAVKMRKEILETNARILETRRKLMAVVRKGRNRVRRTGTFTDPRDGQTYRTETLGGRTWMAEPLRFRTGDIPVLPSEPEKVLDTGEPEIKVFIPTLVRETSATDFRIDWLSEADDSLARDVRSQFSERLALEREADVKTEANGIYTVRARTRCYVYMDGDIDVYAPVYNVFLDMVRIGDRCIEGCVLADLGPYLDVGPDDNLDAALERTNDIRKQTVAHLMEEAGYPHDDRTVERVTETLVDEYNHGRGISDYKLMFQAEHSGPKASAVVLARSIPIPRSCNYVRGGRARELVLYRYLGDCVSPEIRHVVKALSRDTVDLSGNDGSKGVLYAASDVERAIPAGWRLPNLDDLYRMYAALGGRPMGKAEGESSHMTMDEWMSRNGKPVSMAGVRIPRALSKSYAYPELSVETAKGRKDIIEREGEDEEVVESGMTAREIMANLLGFDPIVKLTLNESWGIRSDMLGKISPLVIDRQRTVSCVGFDGTEVKRVIVNRTSRVNLSENRLVMMTEVNRFEEPVVDDIVNLHGTDALEYTPLGEGRRLLFLVKE